MNRLKIIWNDKSFLRRTFAITIPIVLQNLLNNLVNLVDTLMIGQLGETSIAAVGLANKLFFVFALLMFGVGSGSSVLSAQYYGKRELMNIKRVLRLSLLIGVGGSLLFAIPGFFAPEFVMRIFTPLDNTISEGAKYLVIIVFTYPLTAVTMSYTSILRSMNFVKLPVIITSVSILVNVFFNYGLIYGHMGFPKMGVAGAALATLIARIVECGLLLALVYSHKAGDGKLGDFVHLKYDRIKEKGRSFINKAFLNKYFNTAAPVIANEFIWGLGVTMYSLVYGRMGNAATSAITITNTVEQVSLVFFFGICHAAAVLLGNELGSDKLDKAEEHARNYIAMMFVLSLIGAAIVLLIRNPVASIFDVSDEVIKYVRLCITVFAIYMPFRMLNTLFIVAILRSGGDTKATLILDSTSVWLIGIPMAVLGGLILKYPIHIVYAMILIEEIYKLIFGYLRYKKKIWLRNIVS
ncbi:MAG: MATE family efflux transporter [Clostridiales bacterium]|jgi:putative MATE family efflux protein|nr:MATE family efflux transporter [Clostridiales bacterium]